MVDFGDILSIGGSILGGLGSGRGDSEVIATQGLSAEHPAVRDAYVNQLLPATLDYFDDPFYNVPMTRYDVAEDDPFYNPAFGNMQQYSDAIGGFFSPYATPGQRAVPSLPSFNPSSALIGNFEGGDLSDVGGTVGNIAGMATGIPGASFIGDALGGAIGGIFGGSRPHPASNFSIDRTDGLLDFDTLTHRSKHLDTAYGKGLSSQLVPSLEYLRDLGLNLDGFEIIAGGVDDGTGFFTTQDYKQPGSHTINFDPADRNSLNHAAGQFISDIVNRSSNRDAILGGAFTPNDLALENVLFQLGMGTQYV